jgi:hypothetical protein
MKLTPCGNVHRPPDDGSIRQTVLGISGSFLFLASVLACSASFRQPADCVAIEWSGAKRLAGETFSASYVESPELVLSGDQTLLVGAPLLVWDTAGRLATIRSGDSTSVHFAAAQLEAGRDENDLSIQSVTPLPEGVWRMAHVRSAPQPNGGVAFAFVIPPPSAASVEPGQQQVLSTSWRRNAWSSPRPVFQPEASPDWSSVTVSSVSMVQGTPTFLASGLMSGRGALFVIEATDDGWKAKSIRHARRLYPQVGSSLSQGRSTIAFVDADPITGVGAVFVAHLTHLGDSVSAPRQVHLRSTFPATSPRLLRHGASSIALVWLEQRGVSRLLRLFLSEDDGYSWEEQDSLPVPFETRRVSAVSGPDGRINVVTAEDRGEMNRLLVGSWNKTWTVDEWREAGRIVGYPAITRWKSGLVLLWSETGPLTRADGLPRTQYRVGRPGCRGRLTG